MTALTLNSLSRSLGLSPRRHLAEDAVPAIVQGGLIAEWRFDHGAGQTLTDYGGNGHHGQLGTTAGADVNDPSWATSPARLEFDGAGDRVEVPSFAAPGAYHLDLVVRADAASGMWSMLFLHGTYDNDAVLQVFRQESTPPLYYRLWNGSGAETYLGARDVFDDGWHLIQVNHTGSMLSAHVDGVVDLAATPAGTPAGSSQPIWLSGRSGGGGQLYFRGALAWAAWYSAGFNEGQRLQNENFARALMSGRGVTLP
jgi:Concanavalin A-like lectin/glucanases superfamily